MRRVCVPILCAVLAWSLAAAIPPAAGHPPTTTSAPAAVDALHDQAQAAMNNGQFERAAELLETAIRTDPGRTREYYLLAEAYEQAGHPDRAADTHVRLGDAYAATGRHAVAVDAYEHAGRLGRDGPDYHLRLARSHYALKQYLGAVTKRRIAGGVPDRVVDGYYLLRPVPDRDDMWFVCPPESAIYHIRCIDAAGSTSTAARLLEADVWLAVKQPSRALRIYGSIESEVPAGQKADYYYHSAQAALGADDLNEYIRRLRRAIELAPDRYGHTELTAYTTLAERYSQRGDLERYTDYLKLACELAPRSGDLHYQLGNAYWEADDRVAAARQWQIALELDPDHPDRDRMLQLIRDQQGSSPPSR